MKEAGRDRTEKRQPIWGQARKHLGKESKDRMCNRGSDSPDQPCLLPWKLEVAPASRACLRDQIKMYKDYCIHLPPTGIIRCLGLDNMGEIVEENGSSVC